MVAQQAGTDPRPEAGLMATISGLVREHRDRFPALSAAIGSATADAAQDRAFDFGLDRIIDGLHAPGDERGSGRGRRGVGSRTARTRELELIGLRGRLDAPSTAGT